jgi:hypothetical protein
MVYYDAFLARSASDIGRGDLRHVNARHGPFWPAGEGCPRAPLVSFGDLLGVPILPPYYTLRLLPYVVPQINAWRRRMLREKDLTDLIG